jgi:iron complex outermembrane recepter protein
VVRAALAFAPIDNLKITPSIYFQHVYFNDLPSFDPAGSNNPGDTFTQNWHTLNPQYSNVSAGWFVKQIPSQEPSSDQFYVPALKAEWHLASVDVTSSTSYMYRSFLAEQDWTTFTTYLLGLPWPLTSNAAALSIQPLKQNIFTQELRAQSADSKQPLQWTVGLFYTDSRQKDGQNSYTPDLPAQVLTATGQTIQQAFGEGLLPGNIGYYGLEQNRDTQLAGFGQVTYRLFERLSLVAGARVAREEVKYDVYQNGPLDGGASYRGGDQSQTVVNPKYGVNYQLDDNNLVYASATKGDRLGGVNYPLVENAGCKAALTAVGYQNGTPLSYQSDSLWSYELGSKNRLFGGRMQIEASAFFADWSNVQYPLYLTACGGEFTGNLAKARTRGFDFQTNVLVTEAFKVGLSMGYTDAKYATSLVANGVPVVANGEQINPWSSPWVVVPTAEYDFLFAGKYKMYARMDDSYHSKNPGPYQATNNPNSPIFNAAFIPNPSTNQLNIHVGTIWHGWDVSTYALNALNQHPVLYNYSRLPYEFNGAAFTTRPLTIGATANYRW